jgi:hypothetical protein
MDFQFLVDTRCREAPRAEPVLLVRVADQYALHSSHRSGWVLVTTHQVQQLLGSLARMEAC